jgi:hypothetical protein
MTKTLAQRIREDLDDLDIDADVRALLATWLQADDAFNHWFLETTKGSVDDDALMGLLGGYGESQDLVEPVWRAYVKNRERGPLEVALTASAAKMTALQKQ